MNAATLELCIPRPGQSWSEAQLTSVNPCLENCNATERVQWALDYLPQPAIVSSSFGAQSAVMLHLLSKAQPDIPVVLIDTGYLFPETYRFVDELVARLDLNLRVYRAGISPAWQEARSGQLWKKGSAGIEQYNQVNKVEPMKNALHELQAGTWFSGLRRCQSESRKDIKFLQAHGDVVKAHPIADWSDRDVHFYLRDHSLPYHPLWEQGYVSIGDYHSSSPLSADVSAEQSRFSGLVRECGLHQSERYLSKNASTAYKSKLSLQQVEN